MSNSEPYWETVVRKVREQDQLAAETNNGAREQVIEAAVRYARLSRAYGEDLNLNVTLSEVIQAQKTFFAAVGLYEAARS